MIPTQNSYFIVDQKTKVFDYDTKQWIDVEPNPEPFILFHNARNYSRSPMTTSKLSLIEDGVLNLRHFDTVPCDKYGNTHNLQKIKHDEEITRLSSPGRVSFIDHQLACIICHATSEVISRLFSGDYQFYCKKCQNQLSIISPNPPVSTTL